jgi:hypothetical protein
MIRQKGTTLYMYPAKRCLEDHDPVVYDRARPMPVDDLLREAGLDTWAIGVARREMSAGRGDR